MMDKKSANGFQTKASEGGVQRKQLPYSVETPYGFHLDLDFLKYVDDIEKGNTIKRVHIQRRVKGPPKFSTLPRNFSLPGHGARPVTTEKDSTWSGTSTLGPKPRSRVTEVQQIFDFRANEGGISTQRGTSSQGSGYSVAKPRDEAAMGARGVEERIVGLQSRPNLLRASSMPVTLQQRKGSDSSSPDRVVGTPENGSTENMFRASPDVTERRSVPQDRTGLHQQITVALKRVRELEEQVKTIPELKAQICSLREEREKLLLQLQAQTQALINTSPSTTAPSSDSESRTQTAAHRPTEGLSLAPTIQPAGVAEKSRVLQREESGSAHGKREELSAQGSERLQQPSEKSDKQKEELESPVEHAARKLSRDIAGQELKPLQAAIKDTGRSSIQDVGKTRKPEEPDTLQVLQEKLMNLEDKLTQASQELERTNGLLKDQLEENKVKEERILQLSEGMKVEICTTEAQGRPRRESIDAGTVTEKVDFANQETETEAVGRVDQGTDTDKICIEVSVPTVTAENVDQEPDAEVETQDQVTEMEAEATATSPPRPRANSMERGTVTERIATQDQTTETPVAERVNQVTETEGETVTDHPHRPRASSADRGTETERVDTVDRVTETEAAQRTDQQTETETERRPDNNPTTGAEAESPVRESVSSERVEEVNAEANESRDDKEENERLLKVSESVVMKVITESSIVVQESVREQTIAPDTVIKKEEPTSSTTVAEEDKEPQVEASTALKESEKEEVPEKKTEVTEVVETKPITVESVEKTETGESEIVCATVKETLVTDSVVSTVEDAAVKTAAPVRPQRGRKPSTEQVQPTTPQPQAAPVRPRRGSSEVQAKQPQTKPEPQAKVEEAPKIEVQAPLEQQVKPEPQATVEEIPKIEVQAPTEQQVKSEPEAKVEDALKIEVQAPTEQQVKPEPEAKVEEAPKIEVQAPTEQQVKHEQEAKVEEAPKIEVQAPTEQKVKPEPQAKVEEPPKIEDQAPPEPQVKPEAPSVSKVEAKPQEKKPSKDSGQVKPPSKPQAETQGPSPGSSGVQTRPKSIQSHSQTTAARRTSKELKAAQKGSQPPSRGLAEAHTRPTRQGSSDLQSQSQGPRRSSGESQPSQKITSETKSLRRGSSETAQRRSSNEAQATPRDATEVQAPRRGSSESPTSPAALGQVVTRLTGLLGEQWAQLGSSSGAQQTASQQETPSTQKQTAGKRAEAGKGAAAKPAGKTVPAAATTGKPAGKPGPSKMSSIQSQLVSSLSVLSAFYSPAQKAAAANKQQEQGLKSIMKKNGVAAKQGSKGAKKNLKFVGVNGGYETTSSEESSGDEKSKVEVEVEEEEDSSEPEVEKEKEPEPAEKPEETAETQMGDAEVPAPQEEGAGAEAAAAEEKESDGGLLDPESSQELREQQAELEKVDKGFIDACIYVKDRMEEVSSPDKEMRQVLVVLYQEWFKVSSQKHSQADTVRLYLRQVGLTTPTMLPYVVNLTDGNGNMALHYSVSHSNFPVVKLLLDTGLCETDNVNKAGYTPVMLAALTAAESPDDLEVAQQLLQLGDVNARSRQAGQTALMLAVSHGRVAMVKLLLSSGADVNAQDREGSTALMCASEHGHTHIARLLLETGRCDTGLVDKNGQTAQSVAEGSSHQEIVDLLKANATSQASKSRDATGLL